MENKKAYRFDFYKHRKTYFAISIVIMVVGIIFNILFGVKMDIQFSGGAMIKYAVSGGTVTTAEVENTVRDTLDRDSSVSINQGLMDQADTHVTITFAGNQAISLDDQTALAKALSDQNESLTFTLEESSSVDPSMGQSFFLKCLICLAITVVLLLIYIGFRFRKIGGLSAGVTAILALLHDVLVIYFVFVIFRMPINDIFIAVILTILGYSLNDTIVVYDRIRENRRKQGAKQSYSENVNLSLNQTMTRSILTSVTTFMALLVVGVVAYLYGMTTVTTFAFPMLIGVVSGCYSSLFIAAPLYAVWKQRGKSPKAKA